MQEKAKYSYSDLIKLKDDEVTIIVQNLHTDATPIVASPAPHGVTAAPLEALNELIEEQSDSVSAPRNTVALPKTYVAQLVTLFKECDTILKAQLDKLALQFKSSNSEFYNTSKNNRKIVNAPTSATQANGIVTDSVSGLPIFDVGVAVEDQELSATSNFEGGYSIKIPVPGVYTLVFAKEGYQPLEVPNVEIIPGQSAIVDIQLLAAA